MRLLKRLAPATCLVAVLVAGFSSSPIATSTDGRGAHAAAPDNLFCRLVLDPKDKFTRVAPAPKTSLRAGGALQADAVLSSITVNYTGFSAEAQTSFQAAVDIWKTQVSSSVPIVVDAQFADLGTSGILGQAGSSATRDFSGTPRAGTWFPFPLANALRGSDINPQYSHIHAQFNSNGTAPWYFGTDGVPHGGLIDFESVVLHELGHGLGFLGTGTVNTTNGTGSVGNGGFPYIYDVNVVDGGGTSVLSYPNNSSQLAALFQSVTNLFWNGPQGVAGNGGARPRLYAPSSFQGGSTYSHLDDATFPAGNVNSLMTHAIGFAEVIHQPGPIMLGMFRDMGWTTEPSCSYSLNGSFATVGPGASAGSVMLTTSAGCAWTASSGNTSIATITSATSGAGSATITYAVNPNPGSSVRIVTLTIGGQNLTIAQNGNGPTITLDRISLNFGGVSTGGAFSSQTPSQAVRMTQSGAGTVNWTATSNASWLRVANGSGAAGAQATGSGSATLNVSVAFVGGLTSTQTGTITLALTGAGNLAGPITVRLTPLTASTAAAPTGSFDSPANGTTGVAGSIGLTGWALDDVAVTRVRIMRDPVAGESPGVQLPIGDAVFVDGARTDVAQAFPLLPRNTRAGWGYLMLTNFLPNQGNGTFVLYAYADDADGHTRLLGSKTISCDNAHSVAPFGAIDTPDQGQVVSGFVSNFGWVLSPGGARADGLHGGTVNVFVDGVNLGSPAGWSERSDLTTAFPEAQYSGVKNANGVFGLDTTPLANGVHTIAWIVTDTANHSAGVGSRFFTVSNGSLVVDPSGEAPSSNIVASSATLAVPKSAASRISSAEALAQEIDGAPVDPSTVQGRRGFDVEAPLHAYPLMGGRVTVQSEELDRIELHLAEGGRHQYSGYLRTPDGVMPLPIGSRLDSSSGAFTWMPGVGFVGTYDLVFVRWSGGRAVARQDVRIVLNPKGSNRVGPQVIVDLPAPAANGRGSIVVGSSFFLAGWAADLDSSIDAGVDTVHVWAYRVNAAGSWDAPIFLGAAVHGGARPDVAAVYGDRFRDSGYGLAVAGLAPGTYDLALFPWSTVTNGFAPAKVVRIIVR